MTQPIQLNVSQFVRASLIFLALMLLLTLNTYAQTIVIGDGGSGTIGQDAWNSVKGLWFGPAGLVLGVAVFGLAVYFFFKDGVLAVLGVLAIGAFFFFVPAFAVSVQTWARNF